MFTRKTILLLLLTLALSPLSAQKKRTLRVADFGITANATDNTEALKKALRAAREYSDRGERVTLRFKRGTYHFRSDHATPREMYVSNHDQSQPKRVCFALDSLNHFSIEGGGADFIFHGRLVPFAINDCQDIKLNKFSIDFADPQITQVEIVKNDKEDGITFRPEPWVNYSIASGRFEAKGYDWTMTPTAGIAFEKDTRHIVYNTGDLGINTNGVKKVDENLLHAPAWKDQRLKPGMKVAMRSWMRPSPGIFINESADITLKDVKVHYAEGMGLLAQRSTNLELNRFGVCLRGDDDPRYFSTQADATHFSQCRGTITSNNGLYEGMMDDAINIHGVYLGVHERIDDYTLRCRFEHGQAWGFAWGDKGDSIILINSATMENSGPTNTIASIRPVSGKIMGEKEFIIRLTQPMAEFDPKSTRIGIENLTWTPRIEFNDNIVRNNRARGALFSSPRRTVCEGNLFDHTSGTAILLCGDCNGWYESGAVRDLVIRRNTFINALTSMYQFTNAVISVYPEIPNLKEQKTCFHGGEFGGILIEDNVFDTFDEPLLYVKSTSGLIFRNNTVRKNNEYAPMHWNKKAVWMEHCEECAAPGYVERPDIRMRLLENPKKK